MEPKTRTRLKILVLTATILLVAAGVFIAMRIAKKGVPHLSPAIELEGSVLLEDSDPTKRTPLPGVDVTAARGETEVTGHTDGAGYFHLKLGQEIETGRDLTLTFEKTGYLTKRMIPDKPGDQLYIVLMQSLESKPASKPRGAEATAKAVTIKDVRVRYSFKDQSTISVGTVAKEFLAPNKGNVPCGNGKPCSPDGKWRATLTNLPMEAEPGNEFRNVRVSCVAGPCRFVKVTSNAGEKPTRRLLISVLNWSDPAAFLLEADVIRTMPIDNVRQAYPFILGDTMNFALPPNSQSISIQANLDGKFITFPLGPALNLSWADCSASSSPEGSKSYRCQLKPGYKF